MPFRALSGTRLKNLVELRGDEKNTHAWVAAPKPMGVPEGKN
jgi:hypothetical protein